MTRNSKALSVQLQALTPSEWHALQTHLRAAGDESYAAHGRTDTVSEMDKLTRYAEVAQANVLGSGRKPPTVRDPRGYLDYSSIEHESVMGALNPAERHALSVHMRAAVEETHAAGLAPFAMHSDLLQEAVKAERASELTVRPSGLIEGQTL